MLKTKSRYLTQSFLIAFFLITILPVMPIPIGDRILAEPKTLHSYTLNFTPPNKGKSPGNGTKKSRRTAPRSLGNLKAIIPQIATDPILQRPIYKGYTAQERPVFWLNYRKSDESIENNQEQSKRPSEIYIEIRDSESNGLKYFYQDTISKIDYSQDNIKLKLPQDAAPLIAGTEYQWTVYAIGNENVILGEANGLIERADLSAETIQIISDASLEEKAEIYAQRGIWHDLLDTLDLLQEKFPQESRFQYAWDNLIKEHLEIFER